LAINAFRQHEHGSEELKPGFESVFMVKRYPITGGIPCASKDVIASIPLIFKDIHL